MNVQYKYDNRLDERYPSNDDYSDETKRMKAINFIIEAEEIKFSRELEALEEKLHLMDLEQLKNALSDKGGDWREI